MKLLIVTMQVELLTRLEKAEARHDNEEIAATVRALEAFNGGQSLVPRFVTTRPVFLHAVEVP